jgi:hypothetical protein
MEPNAALKLQLVGRLLVKVGLVSRDEKQRHDFSHMSGDFTLVQKE